MGNDSTGLSDSFWPFKQQGRCRRGRRGIVPPTDWALGETS